MYLEGWVNNFTTERLMIQYHVVFQFIWRGGLFYNSSKTRMMQNNVVFNAFRGRINNSCKTRLAQPKTSKANIFRVERFELTFKETFI